MNCANCSTPALFIYVGQGTEQIPYCNACLPSFLRPAAKAGLLIKTDAFEETKAVVKETLSPGKKRRKAAPEAAPEPVTEEVSEEPALPEPDTSDVPAEESVEE